jgi:ABC-type enterobactin transport system permease subunit
MVLSSTLGTHLAAINGGIVTSFTTKHLAISMNVQAARLVP